ncbi:hypothetical protein BJ508DRAFT_47529 [Ascobolus immersus RN42]|uniref:RNase H type-1 domain-containing protein n=1 Tax=Ascobolus immersus RN42 TaxID=1160509 RepID=A0A3N4IIR4_ASCIM|nr:hypothetical protein BJ508DRAFT_47529 [Ascobolus immersus RN42]
MAPYTVFVTRKEDPPENVSSSEAVDTLASKMASMSTDEDATPAPASIPGHCSSEEFEASIQPPSERDVPSKSLSPSAVPSALPSVRIPPTQLQTEISALELGASATEATSESKQQAPAGMNSQSPEVVSLHELPIPQYIYAADPRRTHAQSDGSSKFGFYDTLPVLDSRDHIFHSNKAPYQLFDLSLSICTSGQYRFISRQNKSNVLLFCAGTALDNGSDDLGRERGGCSVVFTSKHKHEPVMFGLEDNENAKHTKDRAELRAAFGCARLRWWPGEGFKNVVAGTSSKYVVDNITNGNLDRWKKDNFEVMGEDGKKVPIENADLWKELREEFERWGATGVKFSLWLLPEELNEAKSYARVAAMVSHSYPGDTRKG